MQSLTDFNEEFSKLDLSNIPAKSRFFDDAERGIDGERKVRDILLKYSDEFYQSVVIWNNKHDFATEADFVCMINGFLVLVETKEWYGTITRVDPTRVSLEYVNINGKTKHSYRTNPVYSITGFYKDLRKYLAPNIPEKETQLRRIVVFTRDEVVINGPLAESSAIVCKLVELEERLKEIKDASNDKPYSLDKELPSWDYYFNSRDNRWYKTVVLNKTINIENKEVSLSEVDSICFDDNKAVIMFDDESLATVEFDKSTILFNSNDLKESLYASFIKFDKALHKA